MGYFNKQAWRQAAKHGDWYLRIKPEYEKLVKQAAVDTDQAEQIKQVVRQFFEELLANDQLALGGADPQLDSERKPITQAVIHHSKREPGYYTLDRLNAVHLLNLYVPYYSKPWQANEQHLAGQPISSNHFQSGKMVFYGYHWWVEADGKTTRLLPDAAIGWQAGNWEVNCRSIAICINDDLTNKTPTPAALKAVKSILREHYSQVEVIGHREANPKTECPGNKFLSGWKQTLVNNLSTTVN